jgi:hypothetical protein
MTTEENKQANQLAIFRGKKLGKPFIITNGGSL